LKAASVDRFEQDGFEFVPGAIDAACVKALANVFHAANQRGGTRHLIDHPAVSALMEMDTMRNLICGVLSDAAFAFKATLFDKHDKANWGVAWHRDISIPVSQRQSLPGWTAWTLKESANYVHPPHELLAQIVALRINIDECNSNDGPLRAIPGSHVLENEIDGAKVEAAQAATAIEFVGGAGDAWHMSPLVLHASSKTRRPSRRRVLHLEFADFELPGGVHWHRQIRFDQPASH
jgi:hypothetical protein